MKKIKEIEHFQISQQSHDWGSLSICWCDLGNSIFHKKFIRAIYWENLREKEILWREFEHFSGNQRKNS